MQQIALTTMVCKPPLTAAIDAEKFMVKADNIHHTIVHLLQASPAKERSVLLHLDEILSSAVVETVGRAPSWK